MVQSVDPSNRDKPGASLGHRSRSNDEASVRGPHQGQQSIRTASTGRTHDCKRPLCCTPNDLLPGGGHPHMRRREFISRGQAYGVSSPTSASSPATPTTGTRPNAHPRPFRIAILTARTTAEAVGTGAGVGAAVGGTAGLLAGIGLMAA